MLHFFLCDCNIVASLNLSCEYSSMNKVYPIDDANVSWNKYHEFSSIINKIIDKLRHRE